jgi:putative molybdopterin biosynthesis protein
VKPGLARRERVARRRPAVRAPGAVPRSRLAEEANKRFEAHLDLRPLPAEHVSLAAALGRVLANDLAAPIDVPPFDRANVDGFAVRAADSAGAADGAPKQIALNPR